MRLSETLLGLHETAQSIDALQGTERKKIRASDV